MLAKGDAKSQERGNHAFILQSALRPERTTEDYEACRDLMAMITAWH